MGEGNPAASRVWFAPVEGAAELLTPGFLDYLTFLHDRFAPRVRALRARRAVTLARALHERVLPSYPSESEVSRGGWQVPPVPAVFMWKICATHVDGRQGLDERNGADHGVPEVRQVGAAGIEEVPIEAGLFGRFEFGEIVVDPLAALGLRRSPSNACSPRAGSRPPRWSTRTTIP